MQRIQALTDITNTHTSQIKYLQVSPLASRQTCDYGLSPEPSTPSSTRHNPYSWKCLPDDESHAAVILAQRLSGVRLSLPSVTVASELYVDKDDSPPTPAGPSVCRSLVQFKCHQGEFSAPIMVEKGQYVVVQGDRGIDIGVVIRVNTESQKSYVERGPTGSILRHATQREVDYWATDLKADEALAVDFCRQRVQHLHLNMEVRHAEYQFDKKKLTFYYDAKARVDFVILLKELYKQFGCRIWMEKVRVHE